MATTSTRTPSSTAPGPANPHHRTTTPLTTGLRVEHLLPTTLAQLNAGAALQTRVDRKYLVPLDAAQGIVDQATASARVLDIDGIRQLSYASTYFDTPDLSSYLLTAHRRRRRFKVRTRTYRDSGQCFLEVKTRGARGATVKERTPYDPDDSHRLTEAGHAFVASCLASAGTCGPAEALALATTLHPVMSTTYRRTTLHLPDDAARATLDTELAWVDLTSARDHGVALVPLAIVETKNPSTPSSTDRLLWSHDHRPTRISKYATGMALLHPELPANKWHRLMHRDLAPALTA